MQQQTIHLILLSLGIATLAFLIGFGIGGSAMYDTGYEQGFDTGLLEAAYVFEDGICFYDLAWDKVDLKVRNYLELYVGVYIPLQEDGTPFRRYCIPLRVIENDSTEVRFI